MSAETIATYGPLVIAAILLVPVVIFLWAMLFEGRFAVHRGKIREATRTPVDSTPLELPIRRATPVGAGALGYGRVSSAPAAHD